MAVYKPSFCFPSAEAIDPKVARDSEETWEGVEDVRPGLLKCKIRSSNQKITGYSIKIRDNNGKYVFPAPITEEVTFKNQENNKQYRGEVKESISALVKVIIKEGPDSGKDITGQCSFQCSPQGNFIYYAGDIYAGGKGDVFLKCEVQYVRFRISSVDNLPQNYGNMINSGLNGTYLYIPFFQNDSAPLFSDRVSKERQKLNRLYYESLYAADYIIGYNGAKDEDSASNWLLVKETDADYQGYVGFKCILDNYSGKINGDTVGIGDTVVIFETSERVIDLCVTEGVGWLRRVTQVPVSSDGPVAAIRKGEHSGGVYGYETGSNVATLGTSKWKYYGEGNNAVECSFDYGPQYRWTITLYQGTPSSVEGEEVSYGSLDPKYYDMTLSTGNIMGSTPDRLQLADRTITFFPGEGMSSPLVLINRYVQLYDAAEKPIGVRVPVTAFDSTYGHVYPKEGAISQETFEQAFFCRFFKYSNDPNAILATDGRVKCASKSNLPLTGAVTKIDDYSVASGDLVLAMGQDDPKENGIYVYSPSGTWLRSGSYKTWGNFIGAIVYVENGTEFGGKNYQSLAAAGGTLYINGDSFSGDSPLFFVEEKPITLFESQITADVKAAATVSDGSGVVDGYKLQVGDLFISGGQLLRGTESTDGKVIGKAVKDISANGAYRVLQGKENGGKIVNIRGEEISYPTTASILKNTSERVFVSPYSGLDANDLLVFKNRVVKNTEKKTNQLRISSVNKKFWFIDNLEIPQVFPSYSKTDKEIPYEYEVKGFFKESPENSFYCYDAPYLTLDREKSNSTVTNDDINTEEMEYFLVKPDNDYFTVQPHSDFFKVHGNWLRVFVGAAGGNIRIVGNYNQAQQASWQTCRWILRDSSGNIVQDTGIRYDKNMDVVFKGLSTDKEDSRNIYIATLYVTDSLGNSLEYSLSIYMEGKDDGADAPKYLFTTDNGFPAESDFTATYDCETRSVLLKVDYKGGHPQNVSEGYLSFYRREYEYYYEYNSGTKTFDTGKAFKGEWEPVRLGTSETEFRDFGIKSDHSYQYMVCLTSDSKYRCFANKGTITNNEDRAYRGAPVNPHWDGWTIAELRKVEERDEKLPITAGAYEVNLDQEWLCKYSLETGTQTQNMTKNQIATLGKHSKISTGPENSISGSVSCLLGSEIVPYKGEGYIERPWRGIEAPTSTNERAKLLSLWRAFAYSRAPKLLRDNKGQAWIVSVTSSSNSPKTFYRNQPDTISFDWREIEDVRGYQFYASGETVSRQETCTPRWKESDKYDL